MDNLKAVIKVENYSSNSYNFRKILSVVGEEPKLYPFDNGITGESHFFVKFGDSGLATGALNLQLNLKGVLVLPIHQSSILISQYRTASLAASMLEYSSTESHEMPDRGYTTVGALKYRPSLHLPVSTNQDLRTTTLSKRDVSDHSSSKGGTLIPTNGLTAIDNSEIQPIALTVSTSERASPTLTFALSRETSISMNLCGQIVTYDLKSLGLNPQVIIELLKVTKSECASWMIVSAFYRRRGEPRNGISVMKSFIEEMIAGGIQDNSEELKPAFLLLSGCETDLARLAKTRKEPESVMRGHYAAAQEYLQKVFGRANHLRNAEDARMFSLPTSPKALEREIQSLRELHDDQGTELARLRTLKRKIEDDHSYERDMRRKYQRQLDDLEKECESARKMERYALDQIKREVATRRRAEERAESERKMRLELIQISDKRFAFEDIINLCEKKRQEAEVAEPVV